MASKDTRKSKKTDSKPPKGLENVESASAAKDPTGFDGNFGSSKRPPAPAEFVKERKSSEPEPKAPNEKKGVPFPLDLAAKFSDHGVSAPDPHTWAAMLEQFGYGGAREVARRELGFRRSDKPTLSELMPKNPYVKCMHRIRVAEDAVLYNGGTTRNYKTGQSFDEGRFTWAGLAALRDQGLEFELILE